jgi:hypothetical protein
MRPYGMVGTDQIMFAEDWNKPTDMILVVSANSPGSGYIIDETGNWVLPANVSAAKEAVRAARQEAILNAWPVAQQMEAIGDHLGGDSTKFDKMQLELEEIRKNFPYPEQSTAASKGLKLTVKTSS